MTRASPHSEAAQAGVQGRTMLTDAQWGRVMVEQAI